MSSSVTGMVVFLLLFPFSFSEASQNHRVPSVSPGLQGAIRYGLKNNRLIRSFRLKIKGAKAAAKGAKAFPNNPELSAGGGAQFSQESNGTGGSSVMPLPRWEMELSLAFPIGGRWGRTRKVAHLEIKYLKLKTKLVEFQYSLKVYRLWSQLTTAWLVLQKRKAILKHFRSIESLTIKRLKHGSATQLDLDSAKISRLQAYESVMSASLQYKLLRKEFATLLAWPLGSPLPWQAKLLFRLPQVQSKSALATEASRKHLQVQAAEIAVQRARAEVALAKSEAVPDLTVSLGYAMEENSHIVKGSLSIALPFFWRNQVGVSQKHTSLRQSRLLLSRLRYRLKQMIGQAYMRYQNSQLQYKLLSKRIKTMGSQIKLLKQGLSRGSFSMFQILRAEQNRFELQILSLQRRQRAFESYLLLCQVGGFLPRTSSEKNPLESQK